MFVYALLQDAGITWVEFVQANTDCCLAASSEEDDDKDDDAGSSQNNVICGTVPFNPDGDYFDGQGCNPCLCSDIALHCESNDCDAYVAVRPSLPKQ